MMFLRHSLTLALIVTIPTVQSQTITDAPTTVPSMVPSSGLIEGVNPSPTMVVVTSTTSSEVPSSVPVQDEVDVPVGQEQESSSEVPSTVPIPVAPIPPVAPVPVLAIPPPTLNTQSELCELNEACAALNLTGQCCPTIDEQFLYCCNGFIEPTCQRNDKCAALGLEGACCPTAGNIPSNLDGIYLDCCSTVPDECATEKQSKRVGPDVLPDSNSTSNSTDAPSSCVRMAAVEYKEALNEYNNGSSAAARATAAMSLRSVVMVILTVATVVTTTLL